MTRPDWIITSYETPPIPVPGFWRAYDDRLGADCSPYGQGATEDDAVEDLRARVAELEAAHNRAVAEIVNAQKYAREQFDIAVALEVPVDDVRQFVSALRKSGRLSVVLFGRRSR